jgi:hypothetical protein
VNSDDTHGVNLIRQHALRKMFTHQSPSPQRYVAPAGDLVSMSSGAFGGVREEQQVELPFSGA